MKEAGSKKEKKVLVGGLRRSEKLWIKSTILTDVAYVYKEHLSRTGRRDTNFPLNDCTTLHGANFNIRTGIFIPRNG